MLNREFRRDQDLKVSDSGRLTSNLAFPRFPVLAPSGINPGLIYRGR